MRCDSQLVGTEARSGKCSDGKFSRKNVRGGVVRENVRIIMHDYKSTCSAYGLCHPG